MRIQFSDNTKPHLKGQLQATVTPSIAVGTASYWVRHSLTEDCPYSIKVVLLCVIWFAVPDVSLLRLPMWPGASHFCDILSE